MRTHTPLLLSCLLHAIALAILLVPTGAQARTIHRCMDSRGHLSFQDIACPPSSAAQELLLPDHPADAREQQLARATRLAQGYAATEQRNADAVQAASLAKLSPALGGPRRPAEAARRTPAPASAKTEPSAAQRACTTATEKRSSAYRERGHSMQFDERRTLDERVVAACGLR